MSNREALKQQGDVIWNIANLLRGPYRPPQYRRVMIPLTVLRRLDCVLESTKDAVLAHHRQLKASGKHDDVTIEKMVQHKFKLTFHNTSAFTFRTLLADADKLAANLVAYIAGFSSNARRILEKFKFEEEIEKLEEATAGANFDIATGAFKSDPSPFINEFKWGARQPSVEIQLMDTTGYQATPFSIDKAFVR